jgi:AraC family transcriptional regulator of adaptative response / DNA-3-methyladenine glycosylase II
MTQFPAEPDANACYLALKARDARFDGRFFTGVTSTGIYCRPVCRVRTPRPENCRFFVHAAQAEASGFRPCLRCRPELAPGWIPAGSRAVWSVQDASELLSAQALQLIEADANQDYASIGIAALAHRLGISERHLRRIFQVHLGVSPLQYLQTRRLLRAKQLLTDTQLAVSQVAALSGFSSVRRFNAAFLQHYRLQPGALRKSSALSRRTLASQGLALELHYRPPLDHEFMLNFLARRALAGVELVDPSKRSIIRTLGIEIGRRLQAGWLHLRFEPARHCVTVRVSETLAEALPAVLARVRALLDLDADPLAINGALGNALGGGAGVRVPGTVDGFELAVRAILGQQVTVQAGCTLATRLAQRFGAPLDTPFAGLDRLFPTPRQLAAASADELGMLGIVRQRQQAILALAQAVLSGTLDLHPLADPERSMAALQALPGIGDWSANYIAMRALRWPDAFPAGDLALQQALGVDKHKHPAQAAAAMAQAWRPWRSYAAMRAWSHSLANIKPQ